MKVLLDTHTLLWFFNGDAKLTRTARTEIENKGNIKIVSSVCVWEIAIKISLKKLTFPAGLKGILTLIKENNFTFLPTESEHFLHLTTLPFHHRDPFDRMMIAQALCEDMTIITKDSQFSLYQVKTVWGE